MNKKRFTAGLLALSFVFGGTAIPGTVVDNSVVASAAEVLTYGDYEYTINGGTVEITKYTGTDEVVEIPGEIDGVAVTSIGKFAFQENNYITKVTIPDGVLKIGGSAFSSCSALKKVRLSSNLTEIKIAVFIDCTALTDITLPSGITSIGANAFRSCSSLENINFPDGLESINEYAFQNCKKLVSISLPDSVTSIGNMAFCNCDSLTDVKLSANINSINKSNFYKCTSLKELEVPASLKTIGGNTFTSNYRSADENKESSFTLKCYNGSAAEKHALENAVNFKVIDADDKTEYPELTEAKFAKVARIKHTDYFQFRINWTKVEGAQQYGVAVNLAGKWKVQAYTDAKTTTFTSPKLKAGSKYDVVICAKVNGKWDTSDLANRAFTIAVK
ncbi:leucine-rich repeat domain-containing protein [Ruminococcus sp.]|uniref:leucine-rich repeat domain-containing protein n=1 Tax=Ruminococcus sp. TaxID=41978 RepID=UPI002586D70B|nr:leucine-rich repeat domain-containing protein [Ruminococcus sp.]MCR5021931.1 leucine-rich repeat domain-containing protein [Ruminococcus sp.]